MSWASVPLQEWQLELSSPSQQRFIFEDLEATAVLASAGMSTIVSNRAPDGDKWTLRVLGQDPATGDSNSPLVIESGRGIPDPRLLAGIIAPGLLSRRRWLDQFLELHPDCMEGWIHRASWEGDILDALLRQIGLDHVPFKARRGLIPKDALAEVWARMQSSLQRGMADPGWVRWGDPLKITQYPVRGSAIPERDGAERLGPCLIKMGRDIREQIDLEPTNPQLWQALGQLDWMRWLPVDEVLDNLKVPPGAPISWIWADAQVQDLEKRAGYFSQPEAHETTTRAIVASLDQILERNLETCSQRADALDETVVHWGKWLSLSVRLLNRCPQHHTQLVERCSRARAALGEHWLKLNLIIGDPQPNGQASAHHKV